VVKGKLRKSDQRERCFNSSFDLKTWDLSKNQKKNRFLVSKMAWQRIKSRQAILVLRAYFQNFRICGKNLSTFIKSRCSDFEKLILNSSK
jgi:hypothetical protein